MQNLQWYPGHMAKTRRLIEANLKLIDVVVEILDARIPFSGRNPHFDDIIKNKPRLLVLNKADLADKNRTKLWIDWYAEQSLKVIPISCTTGMGINTVLAEARALIQDKIDRERERGRNRTLKIMMVGIPNVGKSSLINRLIGKASTKTGDKPGVTRGKQWLRIKGDAELLDTPGILPPKFEDQTVAVKLAYTGAIKDEIMNTELLAYSYVIIYVTIIRTNFVHDTNLILSRDLKDMKCWRKSVKNAVLLFQAVKLIWNVPQIWYLTNCAVQKSVT